MYLKTNFFFFFFFFSSGNQPLLEKITTRYPAKAAEG
jgi:hypothetical protein